MKSRRKYRTNAPNSIKSIRSASQVRHTAQEFKSMALFLKRIIRGTIAENGDSVGSGIDLNSIISALNNSSNDFQGHSDSGFFKIALALFDNDLHVFQRCTIVQLNEGNAF